MSSALPSPSGLPSIIEVVLSASGGAAKRDGGAASGNAGDGDGLELRVSFKERRVRFPAALLLQRFPHLLQRWTSRMTVKQFEYDTVTGQMVPAAAVPLHRGELPSTTLLVSVGTVALSMPSALFADSFADALACPVSFAIRPHLQFTLYTIARMLVQPPRMVQCERYIANSLGTGTVLYALQHASKFGRARLLSLCLHWLRRTGGVTPGFLLTRPDRQLRVDVSAGLLYQWDPQAGRYDWFDLQQLGPLVALERLCKRPWYAPANVATYVVAAAAAAVAASGSKVAAASAPAAAAAARKPIVPVAFDSDGQDSLASGESTIAALAASAVSAASAAVDAKTGAAARAPLLSRLLSSGPGADAAPLNLFSDVDLGLQSADSPTAPTASVPAPAASHGPSSGGSSSATAIDRDLIAAAAEAVAAAAAETAAGSAAAAAAACWGEVSITGAGGASSAAADASSDAESFGTPTEEVGEEGPAPASAPPPALSSSVAAKGPLPLDGSSDSVSDGGRDGIIVMAAPLLAARAPEAAAQLAAPAAKLREPLLPPATSALTAVAAASSVALGATAPRQGGGGGATSVALGAALPFAASALVAIEVGTVRDPELVACAEGDLGLQQPQQTAAAAASASASTGGGTVAAPVMVPAAAALFSGPGSGWPAMVRCYVVRRRDGRGACRVSRSAKREWAGIVAARLGLDGDDSEAALQPKLRPAAAAAVFESGGDAAAAPQRGGRSQLLLRRTAFDDGEIAAAAPASAGCRFGHVSNPRPCPLHDGCRPAATREDLSNWDLRTRLFYYDPTGDGDASSSEEEEGEEEAAGAAATASGGAPKKAAPSASAKAIAGFIRSAAGSGGTADGGGGGWMSTPGFGVRSPFPRPLGTPPVRLPCPSVAQLRRLRRRCTCDSTLFAGAPSQVVSAVAAAIDGGPSHAGGGPGGGGADDDGSGGGRDASGVGFGAMKASLRGASALKAASIVPGNAESLGAPGSRHVFELRREIDDSLVCVAACTGEGGKFNFFTAASPSTATSAQGADAVPGDPETYLGTTACNLLGTCITVHDWGVPVDLHAASAAVPPSERPIPTLPFMLPPGADVGVGPAGPLLGHPCGFLPGLGQREVARIFYDTNILASAPNKMRVELRAADDYDAVQALRSRALGRKLAQHEAAARLAAAAAAGFGGVLQGPAAAGSGGVQPVGTLGMVSEALLAAASGNGGGGGGSGSDPSLLGSDGGGSGGESSTLSSVALFGLPVDAAGEGPALSAPRQSSSSSSNSRSGGSGRGPLAMIPDVASAIGASAGNGASGLLAQLLARPGEVDLRVCSPATGFGLGVGAASGVGSWGGLLASAWGSLVGAAGGGGSSSAAAAAASAHGISGLKAAAAAAEDRTASGTVAAAAAAAAASGASAGLELPPCALLLNRRPKWSDRLDAWTMDFRGRVVRASKKNFQLVAVPLAHAGSAEESDPYTGDHASAPALLFGKVAKDRYSLDFAPGCLGPMTAFAVALTTFASKMAVA